jgi:hypothetical protein
VGQPGLLLCAMNELNVNLQHSILTLAGNGWSNRRIARELGMKCFGPIERARGGTVISQSARKQRRLERAK